VVIARAVGALTDLLHNAGKLLAPHGRLLAMKGRTPEEEVKALPRGWRAEVSRLRVPGLDAERHLVVISRQVHAKGGH
jgi:16S rRNA (guanine527-N7)-methyltransferase